MALFNYKTRPKQILDKMIGKIINKIVFDSTLITGEKWEGSPSIGGIHKIDYVQRKTIPAGNILPVEFEVVTKKWVIIGNMK